MLRFHLWTPDQTRSTYSDDDELDIDPADREDVLSSKHLVQVYSVTYHGYQLYHLQNLSSHLAAGLGIARIPIRVTMTFVLDGPMIWRISLLVLRFGPLNVKRKKVLPLT